MRPWLVLLVFVVSCVMLQTPLQEMMARKPFVEKLGYVPHPFVMRLAAADQKQVLAAGTVFRTMMYFGGLVEHARNQVPLPPDYNGMKQNLEAALDLDPYNMDGYYFAQATLVWDMRDVSEANRLLEQGMRYRDWDFYLPLFAGFNYAYFLKDFDKAAALYRRAGELTGSSLYQSLASRYFYESRETELAISYLRAMIKGARNEAVRTSFQIRLRALEAIHAIEQAVACYQQQRGQRPESVAALVKAGCLDQPPVDPYGGTFFLDDAGRVRTTSKLAFGGH